MNELTIEGVEAMMAVVLPFPKSKLAQQLEDSIDFAKELRGYPAPTVMQAKVKVREFEREGDSIQTALRKAVEWAKGAVREPEEA